MQGCRPTLQVFLERMNVRRNKCCHKNGKVQSLNVVIKLKKRTINKALFLFLDQCSTTDKERKGRHSDEENDSGSGRHALNTC